MPPTWVRPPLRRDLAAQTEQASRVPSDDAGFFVLEALVSLALLALIGTSAMYAITTVSSSAAVFQDRGNADNLAEADLQAARALRFPNYPQPIAARTTTVGGVAYTVTRTTANACPAQPNYDTHPFMSVTSTVVWTSKGAPGHAKSFVLSTEIAC